MSVPTEYLEFLQRIPLFSSLKRQEDFDRIGCCLKLKTFPKGSIVYEEGSVGDSLYILRSGRIKILTRDASGEMRPVSFLSRPGDFFGEMALLTGEPRSATVVAESYVEVLVLYKEAFDRLLQENPTMAIYLSRTLSRRLAVTSHLPPTLWDQPRLIATILTEEERADAPLKPFFTANLAAILQRQAKKKVLALDLDRRAGRLATSIGVRPIFTTETMLREQDLTNPEVVERFTAEHASGLKILSLSAEVLEGRVFPMLLPFLASLRSRYDFIIVNLPTGFSPMTGPVLLEADEVWWMVTAGEIAEARACRESLDRMEGMGGAMSKKIKTVWLQPRAAPLIGRPLLEEILGRSVDIQIPYEKEAVEAFYQTAQPLWECSPSSEARRRIGRLARRIARLRIGVALGSGAAYGFAHIGVLKALEKAGIPVDAVAGTSMGALIGSFYASGKTAAQLEELARVMEDKRRLTGLSGIFGLTDLTLPWSGFYAGRNVTEFLRSVLGETEFADLPIPFCCIATDIQTGDRVILNSGKVHEAVRASISLPVVFEPVRRGDTWLVDGGLVDPVPSEAVKELGAEIAIAVNVTAKPAIKRGHRGSGGPLSRLLHRIFQGPSLTDVLKKMLYTMEYEIARAKLETAQVVITPDLRGFTWTDFAQASELVALGERSAQPAIPKIQALLPEFADFCKLEPG